jgi:tetratricopeptide (TPR) repeat protein
MKKSVFLLWLLAPALFAQSPSSQQAAPFSASGVLAEYEQGHGAYQAGDYQKAAACYEAAVHAGYQAFELYYNLGNCYYKLNQIGKCLLYYEKAKKLDPTDPDLLYNLDLARLRVVDKIITPPEYVWNKIWKSVKSVLSLDQLAVLFLLLLFAAVAVTIGKLFLEREPWRGLIAYIWMPLVIVTVALGLYYMLRDNQSAHEKEAIIMVEKVSVTSSPSNSGTEVFALHEGSKVRVAERRTGYVRITLIDGKVGWAPVSSLQEI